MTRALLPSFLFAAATAAAACSAVSSSDAGGNVGLGGAQDLGKLREIVNSGGIPAAATLDAGGFFAEHYVELPAAACGQTLCMTPMLARGTDWLHQRRKTTLQLSLTTPIDPSKLPRLPLDLVVVVDRSGSMSADGRLAKVQAGLRLLVPELGEQDRMMLVAFDDTVQTLTPWNASRAQLLSAIDRLTPGGSTNLHGGLETGLGLAAAAVTAERQSRVLFLSDGLATAGNTSRADIVALVERSGVRGIGVSTIGVGREFDLPLMRTLAERGAGNFYFLEDAAAVHEVFTEELAVALTPIALDLRLEVELGAHYSLARLAGRSGWIGSSRGGVLTVPAAFVASRTGAPPSDGRRGGGATLFFDLDETDAVASELVASLRLSYQLPGSSQRISQTASVTNIEAAGPQSPQPAVTHPAMQKLSAMYELYRGLHETLRGAELGSSCALGALERTRAGADRWNRESPDVDITADLALLGKLGDNLRRAGYRAPDDVEWSQSYPDCQREEPEFVDEELPYQQRACSAGSPTSGLAPLLLGAVLLLRRRRRPRRASRRQGPRRTR